MNLKLFDTVTNDLPKGLLVNDLLKHRSLAIQDHCSFTYNFEDDDIQYNHSDVENEALRKPASLRFVKNFICIEVSGD